MFLSGGSEHHVRLFPPRLQLDQSHAKALPFGQSLPVVAFSLANEHSSLDTSIESHPVKIQRRHSS